MRLRSVAPLALAALLVHSAIASAQGGSGVPRRTGRLETDTVHALTLANNLLRESPDKRVSVYLPPSYDASTASRYPVVYLLHGYGGTDSAWIRGGYNGFSVVRSMDSLIAAGASREMIVVMPNARTLYDGSFYLNSPAMGNWENFISSELVRYIDSRYRTLARPSSRGIVGHSMGGFGAFEMAIRHGGEIYGAVYALSGCCTTVGAPNPDAWRALLAATSVADARRLSFYPKVFLALSAVLTPDANAPLYADYPYKEEGGQVVAVPDVAARWKAATPIMMIAANAGRLKQLRALQFDIGNQDPLVSPTEMVAMDSTLSAAGVPHTFERYEGNHTNHIGDRLVMRVFPFFSKALIFEGSN